MGEGQGDEDCGWTKTGYAVGGVIFLESKDLLVAIEGILKVIPVRSLRLVLFL